MQRHKYALARQEYVRFIFKGQKEQQAQKDGPAKSKKQLISKIN